MKFHALMTVIIFIVLVSNVESQELGDPALGLKYAKDVCAECHAVTLGESISPDINAATFKDIANTPGMNAQALFVWFRTPHPTMPNFILKIEKQEDLIAYITSLKDKN